MNSSSIQKINFAFAALLIGMVGYFIFWGLGYTNHNHTMLFLLATLFGVFMAFNIGGNDVANSFGTSVGAGTLTIPQALLIAAIFEVSGAVIAGGEVTDTIRKGIVDLKEMHLEPMQFVYIMMSALLAAALWLLFATKKRLSRVHHPRHYRRHRRQRAMLGHDQRRRQYVFFNPMGQLG